MRARNLRSHAAGDLLGRPSTIDIAGQYAQVLAGDRGADRVALENPARDVEPLRRAIHRRLPVIVDRADAILIGQGIGGAQHRALASAAAERDLAGGGVVDIANGRGRRLAGNGFGLAAVVQIAHDHAQVAADLVGANGQLRLGCASNVGPASACPGR